jgi:hypothetical protein
VTRQISFPFRAIAFALSMLWFCLGEQPGLAEDYPSPTVGVPAKISSLVLPGTKLKGKPLIDDAPMVVSVINAFQEIDGFRYDLEFQGFEPKKYNLSKWLVREDGSSTDGLPVVEVEVLRLLPKEGIHMPHELPTSSLPELGGYGPFAKAMAIAWGIGLLCLIFLRGPKKKSKNQQEPVLSLADLLNDRLKSVFQGKVDPKQHAELERMLFAMWRRRLGLESVNTDEALRQIRSHKDAGELMQQLEEWMHSPAPNTDVDLANLLKPYKNIPASELDSSGGGK